ncbi:hypothetical protein BXZ70DRAFT_911390 [Cristinia sonorae]|uniref:Rhodanese domain-containing protein n=1 Tax=Cristinia sonorae TaxID=1940300 RepID=A0A8K0UEF4_9AGAR|nr:hypothetical protein BXZ70DRAFT_911390 [Cristinia sonorae]
MAFPLSSPSTLPLLPTAPAVDPVTASPTPRLPLTRPPSSIPLLVQHNAVDTNISVTSFSEVQPSALHNTLAADNTLILDIRPHSAYTLGRLPNALPMSVPSTLLKRPGFSLRLRALTLFP